MSINIHQLQFTLAKARSKAINDKLRYHGLVVVDETSWANDVCLNKDAEPTTIFVQTRRPNVSH